MKSALILGAGGITGIAWHLGLIAGLREKGVDLTDADLIVGTSAGSLAGAVIAAGIDPAGAHAMETQPGPDDPPFRADWERGAQAFAALHDELAEPAAIRATVGRLALAADVIDEEPYVSLIARRLPVHEWPQRPFLITAVAAATGAPVVWDRSSGVPLDRAVAASCAVPCIFPTVTVGRERYMDGGVRSGTNADVVTDAERVVVLAPLAPVRIHGAPAAEIDALRERSKVALVAPDEEALEAFGSNMFDTTRWRPAVDAAIAQGRRDAPEVAAVWHG